MAFTDYKVRVHLDTDIAHPYWPEREKLINIGKESGISRARTPATRRKALDDYLAAIGMTRAQYEDLERAASRPFYTSDDGTIIVPALHVVSMIVATCDTVSSRARPCPPDPARTLIKPTDWHTAKPPRTGSGNGSPPSAAAPGRNCPTSGPCAPTPTSKMLARPASSASTRPRSGPRCCGRPWPGPGSTSVSAPPARWAKAASP